MPKRSKAPSVPEVPKLPTIGSLPEDVLAPAWLAAIIESADDAIVSKTLQGIITSWNKGAERIFGWTQDETIGKPILILIPPHLHSEETEILSKIRSGQRVEHYETIRVRKDGSMVNVSLTISPIKAPDGTIIGASKIARDITERKQNEERLREQQEIVETINRIGRVLSAELDQQKLVQSVTDAASDLTGAEVGSFFYNVVNDSGESYMLYAISGVPREAFSQFPVPRATDIFNNAFHGEETVRVSDVDSDPGGKTYPFLFAMPPGYPRLRSYMAVPVTSRSGKVLGGLLMGHSQPSMFAERHQRLIEGLAAQTAVAIDNARLYREAQQAIRDRDDLLVREQAARQQAELASRSKDEFLGLLSHELRTPLNAILGWTRMLTTTPLDKITTANALDTIDRNARLQSRLIEDMLDVSRIMTGKLRLDAQPVDPTSVINAAVDTVRPAAEAKSIRIHVLLDFGSATVLGDPVRLQQVVWNLLSNAIKFTPKNGSVKVSLERVNSHFEIKVADSGPGIDEEFLPHVFERFRQGDSSTTKKYGGLGLGLAIVRQLVELHGGTVEASNGEDGGAVFVVKLPIMAVSALPPMPEFSVPLAGKESLKVEFPLTLKGIKVLAVDDDADSRQLLAAVLEQCGAEVATCESATEALSIMSEFYPDVLVSDIGMPGEDGYSLIRRVRESEDSGQKLPAVALTAFARAEDRMKALSAGFNIHVPKPVEPAELMTVVASLVGRT